MSGKTLRVWYDSGSNLLEVAWEQAEGVFEPTEDGRVLERVDLQGNTIGFMIENVTRIDRSDPINVRLQGPRQPTNVTAEQAAKEIEVSYSRMRRLLASGRVEGAEQIGHQWVVPLPVKIAPGSRGPVGAAGSPAT